MCISNFNPEIQTDEGQKKLTSYTVTKGPLIKYIVNKYNMKNHIISNEQTKKLFSLLFILRITFVKINPTDKCIVRTDHKNEINC